MNPFIKGIINSSIDLLYPKRCLACDKVLAKMEKEAGFCADCLKKVKLIGGHYCLKCGGPVEAGKDLCKNCKETKHTFEQNKALFLYTNNMKEAMYRFKYSNRRCYGKVLAKHLVKNHGDWIKRQQFDAIIPVPMYGPKKRRRGYNQAEVLAKALSELTGIPVYTDLITRDVNTEAMKRLNKQKRKKNLLNAFKVKKNVIQFRKVLVVDDIYTTGTTMDEIARALKDGGIGQVYGICACIGQN
jgi:ComF family protein